jgi:hypothetical protein
MDDAFLVGGVERVDDLAGNLQRLGQRNGALTNAIRQCSVPRAAP